MKRICEFLFGKNDWEPKWAGKGIWKITNYDRMGDPYTYEETSFYEIVYSPSRNKWKIEMYSTNGKDPKLHKIYPYIIVKLEELKKQNNK